MAALLLRWRIPPRPLTLRWRGPEGALEAAGEAVGAGQSLAGFVVPVGTASFTGGDGIALVGNDIRINIEELPRA